MLNLTVPENGNIEDSEMQVDFSGLKEYQPFMDASNAFESYLEAYAAAAHIPQSVVSDICQLAADSYHSSDALRIRERIVRYYHRY